MEWQGCTYKGASSVQAGELWGLAKRAESDGRRSSVVEKRRARGWRVGRSGMIRLDIREERHLHEASKKKRTRTLKQARTDE